MGGDDHISCQVVADSGRTRTEPPQAAYDPEGGSMSMTRMITCSVVLP